MKTQSEGVVLVEVMASLTIFMVVALGFTLGVLSVFANDRLTRDLTIATSLAQAKLEEIRMQGAAALSSASDTVDSAGNPGGNFTRTWVVTSSYNGIGGLHQLVVTVAWPGGSQNMVVLSTLVAT